MSTATLNGKTAIVTGGGQGMGRTMALGLVRAGVRVAIVDLDDGALRGVAREARGARRDGAFQTIVPVVYDPHSMEKYMNKLPLLFLSLTAILWTPANVAAQQSRPV